MRAKALAKFKSPFRSKTLVANVLAALVWFLARQYGIVIPEDLMVPVMALLNVLLRLDTDSAITLDKDKIK